MVQDCIMTCFRADAQGPASAAARWERACSQRSRWPSPAQVTAVNSTVLPSRAKRQRPNEPPLARPAGPLHCLTMHVNDSRQLPTCMCLGCLCNKAARAGEGPHHHARSQGAFLASRDGEP